MSTLPSKLGEQFDKVREHVDLAETYAEDGAPLTAVHNLVDAIAVIQGIIQPPDAASDRRPVSLEKLVDAAVSTSRYRSVQATAAVPHIAEQIGLHDPRIRALGEVAALAEQQYRAALVEWIERDWTCRCIVSCAEDPATACSLSGEQHVHPAIPGRPGVYGPCPLHPDAPGDH
ncbi:hypothetical protein ABZV65_30415 [Streptomyces bauhiniae]|uniref:hypothetical protein n=1 Tax=Streptomyces bauhiniae TaxID=2340725 RepID=UPI0033A11AFB